MPTLRELDPKVGDVFSNSKGLRIEVTDVSSKSVRGKTFRPDGYKRNETRSLDGAHDWEKALE